MSKSGSTSVNQVVAWRAGAVVLPHPFLFLGEVIREERGEGRVFLFYIRLEDKIKIAVDSGQLRTDVSFFPLFLLSEEGRRN